MSSCVQAGSKQGRSVVRSISYCWMLCADEAAKVTKLKELLVKFADQEGCTVVFCNSIHQLGSLTSEVCFVPLCNFLMLQYIQALPGYTPRLSFFITCLAFPVYC